ncbi:hypothetical protein F4776DRAFT_622901 [Hypoxylon sp. NC0597]|nr:hypothetical protein F4776DRAFT_622901 [Hypoxylon sp. NC0597]
MRHISIIVTLYFLLQLVFQATVFPQHPRLRSSHEFPPDSIVTSDRSCHYCPMYPGWMGFRIFSQCESLLGKILRGLSRRLP